MQGFKENAIYIRLKSLHGEDACVRSADPAAVVVRRMVVGGSPLGALFHRYHAIILMELFRFVDCKPV